MGVPETHADVSRRRKSEQQTIAQIIENFHRIKEERFNHRLDNNYNISQNEGRKSRDSVDHHAHKIKFADDRIHAHNFITSPRGDGGDVSSRRRISLPSLFHPFSPISSVSPSGDQVSNSGNKNIHTYIPHARRRHSVSHVMMEYSKQDLEELAKHHELMLKEMDEEDKPKDQGENLDKDEIKTEFPKWINGQDLHAFYNGWERKHLKVKKLTHVGRMNPVTDRIRFNSF